VFLLNVQRASQRDVAVKMPFVKLIKDYRLNTAQGRVRNELPE
jgi:hypothetical protein